MSVKIMGQVWDLDNELIKREEKYVLLAYTDHADHDGENMYPSIELICKKTGYKERAIQLITHSLEEKGFLVADGKGRNGTNKWRYGWGAKFAGVQENDGGGANGKVEGVQQDAPKPNVIKPSITLSEKEIEQVNAKVDAIIANSQNVNNWKGREKFAPQDYPLVDWYHKVTGQDCPKAKSKDWHKAIVMWSNNNLTVEHLQAAYDMDIKWRGVFTSPNQLTDKAIALKAKGGRKTDDTKGTSHIQDIGEREL